MKSPRTGIVDSPAPQRVQLFAQIFAAVAFTAMGISGLATGRFNGQRGPILEGPLARLAGLALITLGLATLSLAWWTHRWHEQMRRPPPPRS